MRTNTLSIVHKKPSSYSKTLKIQSRMKQYKKTLGKELAPIRMAFEKGFLSKQDIAKAAYSFSKLNLLRFYNDGLINKKQYLQFSEIEKKEVVCTKLLEISTQDLNLASILIKNNTISRKEGQTLLRTLNILHQLALEYSLSSLVEDLEIKPILAPQITFKKKIVISQKKSSLSPIFLSLGAIFFFLFPFVLWLISTTSKTFQRKKIAQIPSKNVAIKTIPRKIHHIKTTEVSSQKLKWQRMEKRGLSQWGKFYITKSQKEKLGNKKINDKENIFFEFIPIHLRYKEGVKNSTLKIAAKLKTYTLPKEFSLKVNIQLHHPWRHSSYLERNALLCDAIIKTKLHIKRTLGFGVYYLRFSLIPHLQTPFVKNFYKLTKEKVWWVPFAIGSKENIQKRIKNNTKYLQQTLDSIVKWSQKLQNPNAQIMADPKLFFHFYKTKKIHKTYIPTYPHISKQIEKELKTLQESSTTSNDIHLLQLESQLSKLRVVLKKKQQKLMKLVETSKNILYIDKY